MPRNHIDVFVTSDCPSCERVVTLLRACSGILGFDLRVIGRDKHEYKDHRQPVFIHPATCINGILAFYGDFDIEQLRHWLKQTTP